MDSKFIGGTALPMTCSGKMYSVIGAWYWPQMIPLAAVLVAPKSHASTGAVPFPFAGTSITALISRGAGRKTPVAGGEQTLSVTVPSVVVVFATPVQGGRKRQRPLTAPLGGP